MDTIKIWNDQPSSKQLNQIVSRLQQGDIMITPTDSLYGIACDALNQKAIERICRLKGINPDKTHLSIICTDIAQAAEYARFDNDVFRMLKTNTPGPFTFICRAASSLPRVFKGRKTVGIRIPDNDTVREIARTLGHPIMTTSVEADDDDYAISPELIAETYEGRVDFMVEGDDATLEPSTIVDCSDGDITILREGKGELR